MELLRNSENTEMRSVLTRVQGKCLYNCVGETLKYLYLDKTLGKTSIWRHAHNRSDDFEGKTACILYEYNIIYLYIFFL